MSEEPTKPKRRGGKSGQKITRYPLTSLQGLIAEAGVVYRQMKTGQIDHEFGRSLVWALTAIRGMLEAQALERIEDRLKQLGETQTNGYTPPDRRIALSH